MIMNLKFRTRKRMVVLVVLCLYLFCNCVFLSSCSADLSQLFGNWNPRGDWSYDLVGDYSVWRINSTDILLGKYNELSTLSTVIDTYITCFSYNDRFIAVRQLDIPDGYDQKDILQMDFDEAKYFIVDSQTDAVYGVFFTEEQFQAKCDELGVGALGEWIDTYPAPEGAVF